MVEFDLKNFKLISLSQYIYRLFKNHHDTYLMEVTCGTHGVWEVWIQLTQDEILLYKNEGNKGLEKTANLISYHCYNPDYQKRYLKITE
ncbi:hypothetical protein [Chryseobacterium nepalense]|uniref:Uncharacterized protein n=1 Tax=Chryseobacterium nepalense TaxID=1854498 RepID=A0ABY4K6R5_9FLAO|nr:hypothetical protein [Chryseobacterium nepalense]UPQ75900.1 hypothetical protein M0D58_17870 [Chryseobacterium nepalense]